HSVICVGKLHLHRDDRQRRQRVKITAQVYRIFFRGHKTASLTPLSKLEQVTNIFLSVRMVIAKERLRDWIHARSPQLQQKILRPRNPTEHDGPRRQVFSNNSAPCPPGGLAL